MNLSQSLGLRFAALPGTVRAAFWITCTGVTFTGMVSIARTLSPELHVFVVVFFRSLFGLVFLAPIILRRGAAGLRTTRRPLFMLRGVTAWLSLVGYFFAAQHIPLADIAAIGFTRPMFACVAAILFLGEITRARRWSAIAIGIVGGLIVVRPGFAELNVGTLFAVGAVSMTVCNTIFIKSLSFTEDPDRIAIYQGLCVTPLALAAALFVWTTPSLEQFGWLVLMGALGTATQRALARAYHATDATVVTVLDFLRLPIAALFGLVLFAEWPVIWVWIGGAVIVVSSIMLTRKEAAETKKVGKTGA